MTPSRRRFLQASAAGLAVPLAAAAADPPPRAAPSARPLLFKPGLVTYNVAKDWDVPTILKVCKASGLAAVELRTTHKHGVEPEIGPDKRQQVKKQFADSGVAFWGCGSVCEFHSPDPATVAKHVETCKRFAQLVADVGGRGVKVRPNGLPKEVDPAKTLAQIGKALVACGEAAANAGVEIWVEVHGGGTQQPENMKTIMQECGHKAVGVCWNSNPTDISKQSGSVAESFKMLQPWLKSCHINELYKDAQGVYPYRELFRLLRDSGYDRYTLCENARTPPDAASGEDLMRYYVALWRELAG